MKKSLFIEFYLVYLQHKEVIGPSFKVSPLIS